ncbi:MAG: dicarboxylate/amino acid:cation symporter [Butyricicoccus pullicaecorum]|nr:dicarboxylate/amino acid:cation symporter [Butyricicoccus pullicaecorum]
MHTDVLEFSAFALTILFFGVIYYLGKKKNVDFGILTLLATGFGIAVGLVFQEHYQYVAVFGTIYTHVISALVVPLLLFSIISSITNLGESIHLGKIGMKSVGFLLLNTLTASVITLIAAVLLGVGRGFPYETVTNYTATEVPTFVDTIVSLFPQNLITQWGQGQVVPIVIFAILVAVGYNQLAKTQQDVKPFKAFIDAGNRVLGQVVGWVMEFTPYAVLSLIARAVGKAPVSELLPLFGVLILAYVLCAIQLFGVESLLIRLIGRLNPMRFLKGIAPAAIVAFTSQSSVGTIPVTVRQLTHELGVDGDVAGFTAGIGANLGMPGCAGVWPVLLAVFSINVLGLQYSIPQYMFLIVLALVVSVGTVGVPGTATIAATALFSAAGLPIELIVLLSPISSLVDMARTATNVVGAATAAVLVAETEGLLDHAVYHHQRTGETEVGIDIG